MCIVVIHSVLLSVALLSAPHSGQGADERFFEDLARWRTQFENVLVVPGDDYAYHTVGAETLGGAHGVGLYPVGSASERYMLSYDADVTLIYQKRRGGKAVVVWRVPVVESKSKARVKGTIPTYLQRIGYRISPKARLTSAMRKQLAQVGSFATYRYHPMQGGYAAVLRPDGTESKGLESESSFAICPVEKELLRARQKKG